MTEPSNQIIELALITARGGSKGLPGKNTIELAGKPLIAHTIDAAIGSDLFKRVLVSTDDRAIAAVSRVAGAEVLMRPAELAQDHSSSTDVIAHALNQCALTEGYFCLLQPTSPLRSASHIREAAEMLMNSGATSVVSAFEPEHHPLKSFLIESNDTYVPVRFWDDVVSARQSLPRAIAPNGAIYLCDIENFLIKKSLFYSDTVFYIMSAAQSVDIDSQTDLDKVEAYLSSRAFHLRKV